MCYLVLHRVFLVVSDLTLPLMMAQYDLVLLIIKDYKLYHYNLNLNFVIYCENTAFHSKTRLFLNFCLWYFSLSDNHIYFQLLCTISLGEYGLKVSVLASCFLVLRIGLISQCLLNPKE